MAELPDIKVDADQVMSNLGSQLGAAMVRIAQLETVITQLVAQQATANNTPAPTE